MIKMHRTSLKHHICIHTLRGKKVSIASVVVAAKAFVFSSHFLTIWSGLGGRVAGARFLGSNSRSADASRPDVWCAKLVYVCVRRRCFPTVIKYSFNPTHRFAQEQHVWPKPFNAKKALSPIYIIYMGVLQLLEQLRTFQTWPNATLLLRYAADVLCSSTTTTAISILGT